MSFETLSSSIFNGPYGMVHKQYTYIYLPIIVPYVLYLSYIGVSFPSS